jgi:hypothetical protein
MKSKLNKKIIRIWLSSRLLPFGKGQPLTPHFGKEGLGGI